MFQSRLSWIGPRHCCTELAARPYCGIGLNLAGELAAERRAVMIEPDYCKCSSEVSPPRRCKVNGRTWNARPALKKKKKKRKLAKLHGGRSNTRDTERELVGLARGDK